MFSISELQSPSDFKSFSMFRAWWDVLLDYMVIASALVILILLSRLGSVEAGGLICVYPYQNVSLGWIESRYVNARCTRSSDAWILIFYPYIMFILWMCICASHVCWLKIPAISSKLEAFYAILVKIFTTQPKFYRNPYSLRMTQELLYDPVNQKAIDVLLNKLLYLMTEKPFIRLSYLIKHLLVFFFSLVSVFDSLFVIIWLKNFPSTFRCFVEHKPPVMRGYPSASTTQDGMLCHHNIGAFVYALILLDGILHFTMLFLSFVGIKWLFVGRIKNIRRCLRSTSSISERFPNEHQFKKCSSVGWAQRMEEEGVFGEATEYLSGMPSYPDLLFCIELLKRNVHDGHLMYEAVCACIRTYVKKFRGVTYARRGANANNTNNQNQQTQNSPNTPLMNVEEEVRREFHECSIFVRWIANQLGLDEIPNSMDSNHLFVCLEIIRDSLGFINFDVSSPLRQVIADEIQSHPALYKTIIDDDTDIPDFEAFCDRLRKSETFASQYVLMAAATLFRVKIIIIHCESACKLPEIYIPKRQPIIPIGNSTDTLPIRYLTYVSPHFYHATIDLPINSDWPHILSRRMKFNRDSRFRADLRSSAVRSVCALTPNKVSMHEKVQHPTMKDNQPQESSPALSKHVQFGYEHTTRSDTSTDKFISFPV